MRRSARLTFAAFAALLALAAGGAGAAGGSQTFTGFISDDMCGLDHSGMGEENDAKCTLSCVESGSAYVLADREHAKVYQLDDQKKPKEFAGAKVTVVGKLEGDTIHVESIVAAKP